MFRHSSRRLPLNDSINGLSVGFPGREKFIVTPCSYAHLSRLFEINSLPLSVWIRTGSRLSGTRSASIILTTSSPFNDFPAWIARHSRLKLSTTVSTVWRFWAGLRNFASFSDRRTVKYLQLLSEINGEYFKVKIQALNIIFRTCFLCV